MEMDPTAAWGPYQFEVANWSVEAPAAAVLPVPGQYTSVDIFGTCCTFQAPVPAASSIIGVGGQQLVELHYHSAEEPKSNTLISVREEATSSPNRTENIEPVKKKNNTGGDEPAGGNTNTSNDDSDSRVISWVFEQVASEFEADISLAREKMHRYPASLQGLDRSYTVPRFVAIGPYHHDQPHLKQAEKVKHMAVISCVKQCGGQLQEMYDAVASVALDARRLYDKDAVARFSEVDFRDIMFVDACFLVQYMIMQSRGQNLGIDPSLHASMKPNRTDILHDVMLLENQLPWKVVQTVKGFFPTTTTSFLPAFISRLRGCLQDHKVHAKGKARSEGVEDNKPPHLLALLRYYIVGRQAGWTLEVEDGQSDHTKGARKPKTSCRGKRSVSQSAVELAKIGIKLIPAKDTTELIGMALNVEAGILHAELSLPPLSLNLDRASYLVNMAALELCTVPSFGSARDEDSAVCSYLLLLAMLAYREEDVHELRERGLLQGGGGLTNEDALRFFTSLQGLRLGRRYIGIMEQIESYKEKRTKTTKLNMCWYDNKKTIAAVFAAVVSLASIVGTLVSIKTAL